MQRWYVPAVREISRLQAISSTPVTQVFREFVTGVTTLRIMDKSEALKLDYFDAIDENFKNQTVAMAIRSWFEIRIELMGLLVVVPGYVFGILLPVPAASMAILSKYISQVPSQIGMVMQNLSDAEKRFISFERCEHFRTLKIEVGYTDVNAIEDRFIKGLPILEEAKVKRGLNDPWPTEGKIEFKNFSCKYRPDLDNALTDINISIKGGRKIGIVGRTGAGKSTFLSAIYRNFEEYEGTITIDGREINSCDIKELRKKMTIIPQDPHLFADSLRGNLDPNSVHEDSEIIEILKNFEIWDKFTDQKGLEEDQKGLKYMIDVGGVNLSQGEKQLLILCRALLNKNKVVLFDEATANIDVKTEGLIQKAIETQFKGSTMIMVAHRLNTILFCDKVLSLDNGRAIEYGSTQSLQANPESYFGGMLRTRDGIQELLK
jgi:ATP-binding cassette subfamily C (CFTR/MRP) protein 1